MLCIEHKDTSDFYRKTSNLEDQRKNVGLKVFDRLLVIMSAFTYNSWLEIEYQCSTALEQINKEMKEELKRHNVESVCEQIDNYVAANISGIPSLSLIN